MIASSLVELLDEYAAARAFSTGLIHHLDQDQINWRPEPYSSAIAWHLGHQAAVNHYLVRNLTSAEPSLDPRFDRLFDSATPEPDRGDLPVLDDILSYRDAVARSTVSIVERIDRRDVGAPGQLGLVASTMLVAIINHEYQHGKWIEEVRSTMTDEPAPGPRSGNLVSVDGYLMLRIDLG